jgi:hypothetical protein
MEQRLPVRRGGDQGLALPAIDTVAEIAVVDPIAALHAHEPGMGAGLVVVDPADLTHGLSRAPKVPLQATRLRWLDVMDTESKLLSATPSYHRAMDVNLLVGLLQMQRDHQFSPGRHVLLGIDAASL